MKKRLMTAGFALLLTILAAMPVSAKEGESRFPRLVDGADLLTEREEGELLAKLDEISERQQLDVVVVTTDSTEGQEPMA